MKQGFWFNSCFGFSCSYYIIGSCVGHQVVFCAQSLVTMALLPITLPVIITCQFQNPLWTQTSCTPGLLPQCSYTLCMPAKLSWLTHSPDGCFVLVLWASFGPRNPGSLSAISWAVAPSLVQIYCPTFVLSWVLCFSSGPLIGIYLSLYWLSYSTDYYLY